MSLFPAYNVDDHRVQTGDAHGREAQSLGIDSESTISPNAHPEKATDDPALCLRTANEDFYEDKKYDCGNLRVSTLHYPGRPRYDVEWTGAVGEAAHCSSRRKRRRKRYYEARVEAAAEAEAEMAPCVDALRRLLAQSPLDEMLWLRYVRLQEWRGGAAASLSAVEEACLRLGGGATCAWGARRLRAMAAALPPDEYVEALRAELRREESRTARCALMMRLLRAQTFGPSATAAAVAAATVDALRDTWNEPAFYPLLLYTHGEYLQLAGLWEQLVLLLELVAAMNFMEKAEFPPARATVADEEGLRRLEDEALSGGLPGVEVWARVERARAHAHWRPAAGAVDVVDPQRTPLRADVAPLLRSMSHSEDCFLLLVQMIRLAKVPPIPGAGYANAGLGSTEVHAHCAEALLPLAFAARRLPPAHPARPPRAALAALLRRLLDPPHYFSDRHGYLGWVEALWEASCAQVRCSTHLTALLCWRLRWLCSLALLVDASEEAGAREARRIREGARAALRRHARDEPLPFAEFARLELYAGGGRARALRTALHALRGALSKETHEGALFAARVVCEVGGVGGAEGQWALACAVLRRPLPDSPDSSPPPPQLLADALQKCEQRCEEIERSADNYDECECSKDALLPNCAEWASVRVLLAPAARLSQLRSAAAAGPLRYREQSAAALAAAAGRHCGAVAAALAPLYPDNASLALLAGGAALWERAEIGPAETDTLALGRLLPAALRAESAEWAPQEAERAVRAARRETAPPAPERGALLWALRLECEALAPRPRVRSALYAALSALPFAKWLHVRGAVRSPPDADALADLLLERQLRLHTLRDEIFQQ